ncbi:hypothetical protein ABZS66_18985 [Dactylosporangium sp. NPDC005572]|uniref:hypothetical protein n=1 Tax=Dactylosporangium sp. NPDC005572 TaxID=3156889 RepID=UPI0033BE1C6C
MSGYHYVSLEPGLWTVGSGTLGVDWEAESDHSSPRAAADRVAWLNGGRRPADEDGDDGLRAAVGALVEQMGELVGALRGMAGRMETSPAGRDLVEQAADPGEAVSPAVAATDQPGDTPVDDDHAAVAAGLRELADLVDSSPELPVSCFTASVSWGATYVSDGLPNRDDASAVQRLRRAAAVLGVEVENHIVDSNGHRHHAVEAKFGPVELRISHVNYGVEPTDETAAGATTDADAAPAADGAAVRGADPSEVPGPTTPGAGDATQDGTHDVARAEGEVVGPELQSGPATGHHHVAGSVGGPGENDAECACGTVVAGFDTQAEAVAALEQHIADPDGPVQDWWFTFGAGQTYDGMYVVIHGTFMAAREEMFARFGNAWSMHYSSAEAAGVEQFGMVELPHDEWPPIGAAGEVWMAVRRRGINYHDLVGDLTACGRGTTAGLRVSLLEALELGCPRCPVCQRKSEG